MNFFNGKPPVGATFQQKKSCRRTFSMKNILSAHFFFKQNRDGALFEQKYCWCTFQKRKSCRRTGI